MVQKMSPPNRKISEKDMVIFQKSGMKFSAANVFLESFYFKKYALIEFIVCTNKWFIHPFANIIHDLFLPPRRFLSASKASRK